MEKINELDLKIRVAFKSKKLKYLVKQLPLSKDEQAHDGDKSNVVYRLTCIQCEKERSTSSYIGETSRKLNERLQEHFSNLINLANKKNNKMTQI